MVDGLDTRRRAYLDTSARTQLRVAHQGQHILRYCYKMSGANEELKSKKYVLDRNIWTPPTRRSKAKSSANSRGYFANHHS